MDAACGKGDCAVAMARGAANAQERTVESLRGDARTKGRNLFISYLYLVLCD